MHYLCEGIAVIRLDTVKHGDRVQCITLTARHERAGTVVAKVSLDG